LDVPGIKESDLEVKVEDRLVTVTGNTQTKQSSRSVQHTFTLPAGFDQNTMTASLQDGVLTLVVKPLEKNASETQAVPQAEK
jgi:HSP20 family molecular chaperone IbpA